MDTSTYAPHLKEVEPQDMPMLREEQKKYPCAQWLRPYPGPNGQIYRWRMPNGYFHACGVSIAFDDEGQCESYIKNSIENRSHHSLHV